MPSRWCSREVGWFCVVAVQIAILFRRAARRPGSRVGVVRDEACMKMLRQLTNYDDPNSFGSRMRRRRGVGLRALIEQCYTVKGAVRLLDMGGEIRYWNIFGADYLMAHRVSITLVNLSEE